VYPRKPGGRHTADNRTESALIRYASARDVFGRVMTRRIPTKRVQNAFGGSGDEGKTVRSRPEVYADGMGRGNHLPGRLEGEKFERLRCYTRNDVARKKCISNLIQLAPPLPSPPEWQWR